MSLAGDEDAWQAYVHSLAVAILVVEVVGASGAVFTAQGLAAWYDTLERPALAPPNWVFGPV